MTAPGKPLDLANMRAVAEAVRDRGTNLGDFVRLFQPDACLTLLDRIRDLEQGAAHIVEVAGKERERKEAWMAAAEAYEQASGFERWHKLWGRAVDMIEAARKLERGEPRTCPECDEPITGDVCHGSTVTMMDGVETVTPCAPERGES